MIVFTTIMMMITIGLLLKTHIYMGTLKLVPPISMLLVGVSIVPLTYHMPDLWANVTRFVIGLSFLVWFIYMYFKYKLAPDSDFIDQRQDNKVAKSTFAKEILKEHLKKMGMEDFKEDEKPKPAKKSATKAKKPVKGKKDPKSNEVIPIGSEVIAVKVGETEEKEGVVELFIPSLDMVVPGAKGKGYRVRMKDDNTILYYSTNEVRKV